MTRHKKFNANELVQMRSAIWTETRDSSCNHKLGEASFSIGEESNQSCIAGRIIGSKKITGLFLIKRKLTSVTSANQIERSIFKMLIDQRIYWCFLLIDLKTAVSKEGPKFVENKVWDFIIKHLQPMFCIVFTFISLHIL